MNGYGSPACRGLTCALTNALWLLLSTWCSGESSSSFQESNLQAFVGPCQEIRKAAAYSGSICLQAGELSSLTISHTSQTTTSHGTLSRKVQSVRKLRKNSDRHVVHTTDPYERRMFVGTMLAERVTGVMSATISASALANNVHFHQQHKQVFRGLTRSSPEGLAEAWTNF